MIISPHLVWLILDMLLAAVMFHGNAMATSKCWLSSWLTASCAWSMNKQRDLAPGVSVWHISQALHSLTTKSQPVTQRKCYSDWVINLLLLTLVCTNSKKIKIDHPWLNSDRKYALPQFVYCFCSQMLFFFHTIFFSSVHLLPKLWTEKHAYFLLDVIFLWTKGCR